MIELDLFTCVGHKTFQNSKQSARFCEKILLNSIKSYCLESLFMVLQKNIYMI